MPPLLDLLADEEVRSSLALGEEAGFGSLATTAGALPLKVMDVNARIDGLLARVTVSQTFVNAHAEALEATYIFPLPDRAAVIDFRMTVAGRVVEGKLKERAKARQEYQQAIQSGRRAAIAEEDRPDVFTLRVGNLLPGEEAVVTLTLVGPLPFNDGEVTFRFPLVVAPRYIPGKPLDVPPAGSGTAADTDAVPDASRITPPVLLPGFPNPVQLFLAVEVHPCGLSLGEMRCSLHSVLEAESGDGARLILLQAGERLDRDFILRYRLGAAAVAPALLLQPDAEGGAGTFALTVVPPTASQKPRPRDLIFILDRSGSMKGWKMVTARRAVARMVETLTERDRFTVYAFDHNVETPPGFDKNNLVPATPRNRSRAGAYLAEIEDRGGTEFLKPLHLAVHTLAGDASRDRVLVLITDGEVGNEDQILQRIGPKLKGLRVFALGIDKAVNAGFLRRLAELGGGACELVESEERLEEVMDQVHRRIGTPVLTDLRLEPAGLNLDADTLVPRRTPDLFVGAPLFVLGRYAGAAEGALTLTARDASRHNVSQTITARVSDNPSIRHVWARGHLRDLEDRLVTGAGDRDAVEKQIVAASLRFGVLCRFTAYVAVDKEEIVSAGGSPVQVTQPVETPEGWEEQDAAPAAAPPVPAAPPTAKAASPAAPFQASAPVFSYREYQTIAASPPPSPMMPPAAAAGPSPKASSGSYASERLRSRASTSESFIDAMATRSAPPSQEEPPEPALRACVFKLSDTMDRDSDVRLPSVSVPLYKKAGSRGLPRKRSRLLLVLLGFLIGVAGAGLGVWALFHFMKP
jgi:Ca-activated chloride channel family protein